MGFVLLGIVQGLVYGLAASGVVIAEKSSKLLIFYYGDLAVFCAYVMVLLHGAGADVPVSILVSLLTGATISVAIWEVALRRLQGNHFVALIIGVGVAEILSGVEAHYWFSGGSAVLPDAMRLRSAVHIAGATITADQLVVIAAAIGSIAVLEIGFRWHRAGLSIQAVADSSLGAMACGLRVRKLQILGYALSGLLAGVTGVLLIMFESAISWQQGVSLTVVAIAAALIGGRKGFLAATAGGLVLGITSTVTSGFGVGYLSLAATYGIIAIALLVRPLGVFANQEAIRG